MDVFGIGIGYLNHISLLCNCRNSIVAAGVPAKVIKEVDDK